MLAPPNRNRFDRLVSGIRVRRLASTVKNVDVYYTPEPDSAQLVLRLARRNGAKVIVDIHEVYHGPMLDRWLMGLNLKPLREHVRRRIETICGQCDLVMGVSDAVLAPYCPDRDECVVVRSCAPSWFATGEPADVCGATRSHFTVMHGKGDLQRGTTKVLDAIARAGPDAPNIRVVMITKNDPSHDSEAYALRELARDRSIVNYIDLRRGVPMQEMPGILRSCDAGMIAYGRNLGVDSLPNRLFEYMAVGIPVIAPVYATEISKIVRAEKCGLLADFEDPNSIAAAMVQLYSTPEAAREMGRNGREAFLRRHNWDVEVRPVLDRIQNWFPDKENA